MNFNRRDFLWLSGAVVTSAAIAGASVEPPSRPRLILFDGFPIFDPRPVKAVVERHAPDSANALDELWRSRIFEHQ